MSSTRVPKYPSLSLAQYSRDQSLWTKAPDTIRPNKWIWQAWWLMPIIKTENDEAGGLP